MIDKFFQIVKPKVIFIEPTWTHEILICKFAKKYNVPLVAPVKDKLLPNRFLAFKDENHLEFYKNFMIENTSNLSKKMNIPADIKYTKDHEWIKFDGEIATVGITDFAQGELGDIVYVEIDTLDSKLDAEEVFGSVEAVKTVSDLFMPVTGEIIEVNELLEDTPEIVNEDPYGKGWMVKVRCSDLDQSKNLLDHESYDTLLKKG